MFGKSITSKSSQGLNFRGFRVFEYGKKPKPGNAGNQQKVF